MSAPTAHWPTNSLLTSLARAGWGGLGVREHHGLRATLTALVTSLPYGSGAGHVTAAQVAQRAGYSERWTRRKMHQLEALGVVVWTRGGVVDGKPLPGHVRIVKTVLVELIRAARPLREAADAARRAATRARIATLRFVRNERRRLRRSAHAELGGSLPSPPGEESSPPAVECRHGEPRGPRFCALCRHAAAADRMTA